MELVVPDLVSSSYFPALAATQMSRGQEGAVELTLRHIFPARAAAEALRDGTVQFMAGPAHAALLAFPRWKGVKILMALSQHTYWMLVVRTELAVARNRPEDLHDLDITAAPGPDLALRQLLSDWGIDPEQRRIRVVPPPRGAGTDSFGVRVARAMSSGSIDAFWANSMAAQIAISQGVGRVVIDPRRGDGPAAARMYTFPALLATSRLVEDRPSEVRAVVHAVTRAQVALRAEPELARHLVADVFPPLEAGLIEDLIRRDGPYYRAEVDKNAIDGLNRFSCAAQLLDVPVDYKAIVENRLQNQ